jgi:uncharacterized membrane protein YcaP (DUF421 family)
LAFTIFLRTLVIYLVILAVIRLMGKREVGQLSTFDFVVAIMIAEIAVLPLEQIEMPLFLAFIPILTLVGAEMFLSYLCLKIHWIREVIDGAPSILIHRGKIIEQEMRKLRYNMNDLLSQLREKSIVDVSDVEYAILETSGELSVILKSDRQPLTPRDLGLETAPVYLPLPVVFDGEVCHQNLKSLERDENWLRQELLRKKGLRPKDILFASFHPQRGFYISLKERAKKIK